MINVLAHQDPSWVALGVIIGVGIGAGLGLVLALARLVFSPPRK